MASSIDIPETPDRDKYAPLMGPGMPFEKLPLPELIKVIDSQADEKLAFHLRFTCKTLYNQQFDIAMTLPRSFIPADLDFFSLTVAPTVLNLYNLSDEILQEFGFIVPPTKITVQFPLSINQESLSLQGINPSLLRLINYPIGKLKTFVLREDLKITNSLKILLNEKSIKIDTLPSTPESYDYFETHYLGNRHLNLLTHFYRDARRCDRNSYGFGRSLQEGDVPNNVDDLKRILDNYEKIIKNPWGNIQICELTHKGKIRRPLLKYKNDSQMTTAIIWICHCYKLKLDLIEDLIYKISEEDALIILNYFNNFIPDFTEDEEFIFNYVSDYDNKLKNQNILESDPNLQKHNLTRMQAFSNGLDALCSFNKKIQFPLIKKLFAILTLDHLKNLKSKKIDYYSFNETFRSALQIVHDQLLPLSEGEFSKFLTHLSDSHVALNLLEDGAEYLLRDMLEQFKTRTHQ